MLILWNVKDLSHKQPLCVGNGSQHHVDLHSEEYVL